MLVRISLHAKTRYRERFPNLQIPLESICDNLQKYGVWTKETQVYIHPDHEVIFIVSTKNPQDPTLVTVLTVDHYRANTQFCGFLKKNAFINGVEIRSSNLIEYRRETQIKVAEQNAEDKLLSEKKNEEIRAKARQYAHDNEFKTLLLNKDCETFLCNKFLISKRKLNKIFIEEYYSEVRKNKSSV